MMAAHLRGAGQQALGANGTSTSSQNQNPAEHGEQKTASLVLKNRAGESKSPYVNAHRNDPVAWQIWGDEAIAMAKKENRLLFVSIGYSACHWCHVMHQESFSEISVAEILNESFIPIKIDREERPDIDRIYMNFVQATTGSGGWPLNVFITPELEPVFGGTYWPGPSSTINTALEDQVDFLGILNKLSTVWKEQEARCRQDSAQILIQLKNFAAEGTHSGRLGEGPHSLDIELLEEANQHFKSTFDAKNGGFGGAPKFPTPSKISFLLGLGQYPDVVIDVIGAADCQNAQAMALTTLRKMARGGIHDHIGNGFARYSVAADWSLPHFEKMLYDNAQLLHVYLDAFLLLRDPEMLGVVYDIATYLTTTLCHSEGGFYSSEDADSLYRSQDTDKREGAFYVWTKREFESILGTNEPILSAFYAVSSHGNVNPENDLNDEFIDQNVLSIAKTPRHLADQFGMQESEIVRIVKEGKTRLREHRDKERVKPALDEKIVTAWNGIAIGALARTGAVLKGFDPERSEIYLAAARKCATFLRRELWDEKAGRLYRVFMSGRGDVEGFAGDYALLIDGLLNLYEATFEEEWLAYADTLQSTQNQLFHDPSVGGFFSTALGAAHTILRLKDGMDSSEPSSNGVSASNLYRLSSLLNDESYAKLAAGTVDSFEAEIMQYPWLFPSFMPALVAGASVEGVKGVVVAVPNDIPSEAGTRMEEKANANESRRIERLTEFENGPRGALTSFIRLTPTSSPWLRNRNTLLKDFGLRKGDEDTIRVMTCVGGKCSEERITPESVAETTPSNGGQGGSKEPENEKEESKIETEHPVTRDDGGALPSAVSEMATGPKPGVHETQDGMSALKISDPAEPAPQPVLAQEETAGEHRIK